MIQSCLSEVSRVNQVCFVMSQNKFEQSRNDQICVLESLPSVICYEEDFMKKIRVELIWISSQFQLVVVSVKCH